MRVGTARQLAAEWVVSTAGGWDGFRGAYFVGSANWLPDTAELPVGSDLDVMVVLAGSAVSPTLGKTVHRGVLIELSNLAEERLGSAESVLGDYHLAPSFTTGSLVADPSGRLATLQADVRAGYARRSWVHRRCEHARDRVVGGLRGLDETATYPDQVIGWAFPTGVTTHILLVAGLRNPTVRRRYAAVRELLAEHGRLDLHESLLSLFGADGLSRRRAEHHLAGLGGAFDAAAAAARTAFPFSSDLTPPARPIAIDGTRSMIEAGLHREAAFWLVAAYSRCQRVLLADAPLLAERFDAGYRALLGDLGIGSYADLRERADAVLDFLPAVWAAAEAIIAANPA